MLLPDWYRNPTLDEPLGYEVWIRSTPTKRGVIISPKGNYLGPAEFSDRRYSVALKYPGNHFELVIGSVLYDDGFDTEDVDEPLKKFLSNKFKDLIRVPTTKTIEMQSLSEWDGDAQSLNLLFDYYIWED